MKTSSCKAKGRRACADVVELLLKHAPTLQPDDIRITSSGATGEDILLSPEARKLFPWVIEVKNTETINIWQAYAQAVSHLKPGVDYVPILFFRRNRSELMACMKASDFVRLAA